MSLSEISIRTAGIRLDVDVRADHLRSDFVQAHGHQQDAGRELPGRQHRAAASTTPPPKSWRWTSSTSSKTRSWASKASKASPRARARASPTSPASSAMNRNIDVALQEVQNRILQVNNQLPTLLYPPVITKTNPEDQPIMWVMVTADDRRAALPADDVRPKHAQRPALDARWRRQRHARRLRGSEPARLARREQALSLRAHLDRHLHGDPAGAERAARRASSRRPRRK